MIDVGAVNKVMSIQNDSLIRAYGLEELSGNAIDRAYLRRDATVSGATQNGDRTPYGAPCYTFDGLNDYVNCDTNISDLDNWNSGTVIALVTSNTITGGTDDIFHIRNSDGTNEVELRIIDAAAQWIMLVNSDSQGQFSVGAITADVWYTFAIRWQDASGDGNIYYYKNAVQEGATDSTANTMSSTSWNQCKIGSARTGGTQYWSGCIGPVFCWNTRLSEAEITLADKILRNV
jgi:hypothetical protein